MKDQRTNDWQNQLFVNNDTIMRNARQDVQDIRREMKTYLDHEFTEDDLAVNWVLGNKEEFDTTFFKLTDFYFWAKDNCQDKAMWTTVEQVHFEGNDFVTKEVFDVYGYVEANEDMLVKDFFNKFK